MINKPSRAAARIKRHYRIRNKVKGTAQTPRLAVFRSNKHMYVQLIDDVAGVTIAAASTMEAEIAGKLESTEAVFDRGGYVYHGKVAALAEAAREAGLQF